MGASFLSAMMIRTYVTSWYVQIGKTHHKPGPDEQITKQKYHALMAGRQPATEDNTPVYEVLREMDESHRGDYSLGLR